MSFWCLQFPPKNEQKQLDMRFHISKVEFVCSFFGGNVSLKKMVSTLSDLYEFPIFANILFVVKQCGEQLITLSFLFLNNIISISTIGFFQSHFVHCHTTKAPN